MSLSPGEVYTPPVVTDACPPLAPVTMTDPSPQGDDPSGPKHLLDAQFAWPMPPDGKPVRAVTAKPLGPDRQDAVILTVKFCLSRDPGTIVTCCGGDVLWPNPPTVKRSAKPDSHHVPGASEST